MHPAKRLLLGINVIGGIAVLFSYAHGFLTHQGSSGGLWGGVPESMKSVYTIWMFAAAAGYLLFTHFLFFRVKPQEARIANRFSFSVFNIIYILILVPSALWMPLTFKMLASPNQTLWLIIRLILWCVGLTSVVLIIALLGLRPRKPSIPYWLALFGSIAFAVQTALLDATIWIIRFPA